MSNPPSAIETQELTKRYDGTLAVDGLDLRVDQGEIYGFLGANGAGKSTTIGILLDYLRPTSGTVRVLDRNPEEDLVAVHDRVGVLPDRFGVYEGVTGRRHIKLVADTKAVNDDPETLLARVGLEDAGDTPAEKYSQGMQQRLALAMALVGEPELLILDEPFTGLDPHGVRRMREIVHEENDRGATVFFSSHVLGQVELVCDRVGILHDGQLIAEGSLSELRDRTGSDDDASMEDVFVSLTDSRIDMMGGEVQ